MIHARDYGGSYTAPVCRGSMESKCRQGGTVCQGPFCPSNNIVCDECAEYHDENPSPTCPCDDCVAERVQAAVPLS